MPIRLAYIDEVNSGHGDLDQKVVVLRIRRRYIYVLQYLSIAEPRELVPTIDLNNSSKSNAIPRQRYD